MNHAVQTTLSLVLALLNFAEIPGTSRLLTAAELGLQAIDALPTKERVLVPLVERMTKVVASGVPNEFRELGEADREAVEERLRSRLSGGQVELLGAAFLGVPEFFRAMLESSTTDGSSLSDELNLDQRVYMELLVRLMHGAVVDIASQPELVGRASVEALRLLQVTIPNDQAIHKLVSTQLDKLVRRPVRVLAGLRPRLPEVFVAREELSQLRRVLANDHEPSIQVVRGMRGAGKSQLASAYAADCERDGWPFVAWITATSQPEVERQLASIARSVGVAVADTTDVVAVTSLLTWLNDGEGESRLIVFDNVERWDDITDFIPRGNGLRVVLTSIVANDTFGPELLLNGFSIEESVELLLRKTVSSDADGAENIANRLQHLPLALAQAASTMSLLHIDFEEYGRALDIYPVSVTLKRSDGDPYRLDLAAALGLAIDALVGQFPAGSEQRDFATLLLNLMSVFSEGGIPRAWTNLLMLSPFDSAMVVGTLMKNSIVFISSDEEDISLHRLTAMTIRDRLADESSLGTVQMTAASLIRNAFGKADLPVFAERRHALNALSTQLNSLAQQPHSHEFLKSEILLEMIADFCIALTEAGNSPAAVGLHRWVTASALAFGATDPRTLRNRDALGRAYLAEGEVTSALELLRSSYEDRLNTLGDEHLDTLHSLNNLAEALQQNRQFPEAIALHRDVLELRTRLLGPDHPDVLASQNNLATTLLASGNLDEALPLLKDTLASTLRVRGPDHPDTLGSRNNLATAYRYAKRFGEAADVQRTVFEDRVRVLGLGAPDTIFSRSALSGALSAAQRFDQALEHGLLAVEESETLLGPTHADTISRRNHLALIYVELKNYIAAAAILNANLTVAKEVHGPRATVLGIQALLAGTFSAAGNFDRAIPLLKINLDESIALFGAGDPSLLDRRNSLAFALQKANRHQEALQLFEQNLEAAKTILSLDHPDLLGYQIYFASSLSFSGDHDAALINFRALVHAGKRAMDPQHPIQISILVGLGNAYRYAGKPCLAIEHLEKATRLAVQILGSSDQATLEAAMSRDAALGECAAQKRNA